jgi:Transposase DDE domain
MRCRIREPLVGVEYVQNSKVVPALFPKLLYEGRARIEQTVGKLKHFKQVALRCENPVQNHEALLALACAFILIKSVHTA